VAAKCLLHMSNIQSGLCSDLFFGDRRQTGFSGVPRARVMAWELSLHHK